MTSHASQPRNAASLFFCRLRPGAAVLTFNPPRLRDMIEAYKRDKIPSYLSYPLKFEELVTSLGATGEETSGKVWFNAINAPRQNQNRVRYPLIETQFWSHRPEASWYFLVKPIPRSLRETAHSLLVSGGLGTLREWLAARKIKSARYPGGLHTHRPSLRISYVVSEGLLDYEPA